MDLFLCFKKFMRRDIHNRYKFLTRMASIIYQVVKQTKEEIKCQNILEDDWEVPPPLWLVRREEQMKREEEEELKNEKAKESLEFATNSPILDEEKEKDNGNAEESLDNTAASPLDQDWGKELPAPSTAVAAPSTPVWRPWEENIPVVNCSAAR